MDVRHLRYFVCVFEAGNVSRAALALHVAQPAVSKQIAQLENELGIKLFLRSVRGVTATQAGLAVYQHAKSVLKQMDATVAVALQAGGGVAGRVGIGLPSTISSLLGISLLGEVLASLPRVRLEVTEGASVEISQMLSQGRLDLAVVFGTATHTALRIQPLVTESLWVVGKKGSLAGRRAYSLEEAAKLPLLMMSRPNFMRDEIDRIYDSKGIAPNVVAEVNGVNLMIEAVQAGYGYCILPSCAVDRGRRNADVDAIELLPGAPRRTVCIATSMLFPVSLAAQRVYDVFVRLARCSVEEGRWGASLVDGGSLAPL